MNDNDKLITQFKQKFGVDDHIVEKIWKYVHMYTIKPILVGLNMLTNITPYMWLLDSTSYYYITFFLKKREHTGMSHILGFQTEDCTFPLSPNIGDTDFGRLYTINRFKKKIRPTPFKKYVKFCIFPKNRNLDSIKRYSSWSWEDYGSGIRAKRAYLNYILKDIENIDKERIRLHKDPLIRNYSIVKQMAFELNTHTSTRN